MSRRTLDAIRKREAAKRPPAVTVSKSRKPKINVNVSITARDVDPTDVPERHE